MPDRETVIRHLQIIRTWAAVGKEPIYHGIEPRCCEDVEKWADDALALIREQEPVKPKKALWIRPTYQDCHCSNCEMQPEHEPGEDVPLYPYCPYCGAEMEVKYG